MKHDRRIWLSVIWLILGAVLFGLGLVGELDEFWSGMGGGLIGVGVVRLVQFFRYRKNDAYREKWETEVSDERNQFLRNKAWAWAGYLFVLISAVAIIVLRLMGQDLLSTAAGYAVCLMVVLYWGCYLVLRRKY
ncbi:MAG: hypothetical protein E7457_01935 [Ruminococcaceae bacterium]|nr:hypothetical protein [Oscillospiraceae bacterium]